MSRVLSAWGLGWGGLAHLRPVKSTATSQSAAMKQVHSIPGRSDGLRQPTAWWQVVRDSQYPSAAQLNVALPW